MKPWVAFLQETAWVLYALYFQPEQLKRRLRAGLTDLRENENPVNLSDLVSKQDQAPARRYLGQMALLCLLAGLPFLFLAPTAPQPPTLSELGLMFGLLGLSGLGLAVLNGALGPGGALTLALVLGATPDPALGLTALRSAEVVTLIQTELLPGLLIGLPTGLITGGGALIRWRQWTEGLAGGVAVVVAGGVAVGVAVGVAGGVASLPALSALILGFSAGLLGFTLGSQRWGRGWLIFSMGLLGFIALVFLPDQSQKAVIWLLAGVAGFFRLPLFLVYAVGLAGAYFRRPRLPGDSVASSQAKTGGEPQTRPQVTHVFNGSFLKPWRWDALIPFRLPYLDRLLASAIRQDRATGLALVEEVAITWRQDWAAEQALIQLAAAELAAAKSETTIAAAADNLAWLPETLPPMVQPLLAEFRSISGMVSEKLAITDDEAQLTQLSRTTDSTEYVYSTWSSVIGGVAA